MTAGVQSIDRRQKGQAEFDRLNVADPATGRPKLGEANAAAHLQTTIGARLERAPVGSQADFVIMSGPQRGKTVDFLYVIDGTNAGTVNGINRNFLQNFEASGRQNIIGHLGKADIVPLDYRNLTPSNQAVVNEFIRTLPPVVRRQIIWDI